MTSFQTTIFGVQLEWTRLEAVGVTGVKHIPLDLKRQTQNQLIQGTPQESGGACGATMKRNLNHSIAVPPFIDPTAGFKCEEGFKRIIHKSFFECVSQAVEYVAFIL